MGAYQLPSRSKCMWVMLGLVCFQLLAMVFVGERESLRRVVGPSLDASSLVAGGLLEAHSPAPLLLQSAEKKVADGVLTSCLAVLLIEPRPHFRMRATLENLLAVSSRWKLQRLRLYVTVGSDLKGWFLGLFQLAKTRVEQRIGPLPEVALDVVELGSRSLSEMGYSRIVKDARYISRIALEGSEDTTHLLVTQTDAWLSMGMSAPSVWEFASRYDYVGCPGLRPLWETLCPVWTEDGVCSLNGGLSLRSLKWTLRGMLANYPWLDRENEDVYSMRSIVNAGGRVPSDEFGRQFCSHIVLNDGFPLGYHKLTPFHPVQRMQALERQEPGLASLNVDRVVFNGPRGSVPGWLTQDARASGIEVVQLDCALLPANCTGRGVWGVLSLDKEGETLHFSHSSAPLTSRERGDASSARAIAVSNLLNRPLMDSELQWLPAAV
jgi:hypothetical protein